VKGFQLKRWLLQSHEQAQSSQANPSCPSTFQSGEPVMATKSIAPKNAEDKKQSKLFIDKAREIGADEDKSAADEVIGRLAKTPPEPRKQKDDK
jgi:hypothetical protein